MHHLLALPAVEWEVGSLVPNFLEGSCEPG